MNSRHIDNSWNFEKANTKILTHSFHKYPAMMIPQVAGRIIDKYCNGAKYLFDPYCGTGTSLVEANLRNINAIGTDLNPLARLVAKAKTTELNIQELDLYLKDFNDKIFCLRFGIEKNFSIVLPSFKNIDYWFKKDTQEYLAIIFEYIQNIKNEDIKNFFLVAFSETVRESSLTRNGEFKLYRIAETKIQDFNPDVLGIMEQKLSRNKSGLVEYLTQKKNTASSEIFSFNTVDKIPENILGENSVDLVVTSPPYGDSRTTVAYGQFSRLTNQWLGISDAANLDSIMMGGNRKADLQKFNIKPLDSVIERIGDKDKNRVKDVYSFYKDYQSSINNISKIIKKGGHACYVVGNRKVKGETLPTDEITKEIFQFNGFNHKETIVRKIPNKRMPSKNSPSNKIGIKDTTMEREFIVVMQKT